MYKQLTINELESLKAVLLKEHEAFKAKGLSLDMSRGKPCSEQLELSAPMLGMSLGDYKSESGFDCRNYGLPDGIDEARRLFAEILGTEKYNVLVGGNASLQLMYDMIATAMLFGVSGDSEPWSGKKIKFLCPVPGYDRHFTILETFGIEMINVPMNAEDPDIDMIERLVAEDESIKGMFCVPMYSNPDGFTYSDKVVRRLAAMKTKAADFRIFWDNAYCVHHLTDTPDVLLDIIGECGNAANPDRALVFASTSKISFAGGGICCVASSLANIAYIRKHNFVKTIGFDKLNQLRHAKFFKDADGVTAHMNRHRELIAPKFKAVVELLESELRPHGLGEWHEPRGGYFISFNGMNGTAKRVVELCKQAGVVLTGAGATFPYGKDSDDKNIRIAPTFPPISELISAMEVFCVSVKLASVEILLAK